MLQHFWSRFSPSSKPEKLEIFENFDGFLADSVQNGCKRSDLPTSRSSRARPAARALPGYQITPPCVFFRFSNPEQMAAAQREAVDASGFKPRSGKQNAQIGLKGFTQVGGWVQQQQQLFKGFQLHVDLTATLHQLPPAVRGGRPNFAPKLSVVNR